MARHYTVTPQVRPGKRVYSASFFDSSGKRVTRSLLTADAQEARAICDGLVICHTRKLKSREEAPAAVADLALDLYLGEERGDKRNALDLARAMTVDVGRLSEVLGSFNEVELGLVAGPEIEKSLEKFEHGRTRDRLHGAQSELRQTTAEKALLERSALGLLVKARSEMPSLEQAAKGFEQSQSATVSRPVLKGNISLIKRFTETLAHRQTPAEITPEDIEKFLTARAMAADEGARVARRRNDRIRVGCYLNWCAKTFGYRSPMEHVKSVSKSELLNERGEIVWHDLVEVEAVISKLDVYWQALVASLAYGGLQLAELCWLRRCDVDLEAGTFWVTTVKDPADETVVHKLKTFNRRRQVHLEPTYLLPRLKAFAAAGHAGQHFFFTRKVERNRKRTLAKGSPERWLTVTLSHKLRDDILPENMNALTLRHTAGSLAIRLGGMSLTQVAAFLGNTAETCALHYARLLGSDVKLRLIK